MKILPKIKSFVIKRSRWANADYARNSIFSTQLFNPKNKRMCCLGFACFAAGVPKTKMENIGEPQGIPYTIVKGFVSGKEDDTYNAELTYEAIKINDDRNLTPEKRESRLTSLFKRNGIKVTFVD